MKRFLVIFLVVLFIGGIGFLYTKQNKTYWNEEDAVGNTAGNLYNGGLFCESGDKIYFSNSKDEGSIYVMNTDAANAKKINDDMADYINVTGKYIFYARRNNMRQDNSIDVLGYNTTGIYRTNKDGRHMKMMYNDPSGVLTVAGNNIYYQHYNTKTGLTFYKVKINGKNNTKLSEESIMPASVSNGYLYYCGVNEDHDIHRMNLEDETVETLISDNCFQPIVTDQYIYYMDLGNDYQLVRTNLDGNEKETMIDQRIFTYNISTGGKYIFYQTDGKEENGFYQLNTETGDSELIRQGDFKNINVTSNFVFFEDTLSGVQYIYSINGNVELFEP